MKNKRYNSIGIKTTLIGLIMLFTINSYSQKQFPNTDLKLIDGETFDIKSIKNNLCLSSP